MRVSPAKTTCSVVIATYNRPEALAVTLEDLARQSLPPDEVLVIDQSVDETGKPLDQSCTLRHSRLKYFHGRPANAQKARNFGIAQAIGDVVLLVDDDMRLPEGFVEAHMRNYEDTALGGVAGQVLKPGQKPQDFLPLHCVQDRVGWVRFPLNYAHRTEIANWPSCNGSVRKRLAVAVGGFDEQFTRTLFDDTDFSKRLHDVGAKIVFDPEAMAVHRKVASGGWRPGKLDDHVMADAESWAVQLYFWRKNFSLWSGRWQLSRLLRGVFVRKDFLRHPHSFFVAAKEMVRGWHLSSERLAEGPRYGWTPATGSRR
ncbi:MAG: glycosyltransferase family 2 protein [Chthoniobacterales bacterium]